jgi:hypothetical protein
MLLTRCDLALGAISHHDRSTELLEHIGGGTSRDDDAIPQNNRVIEASHKRRFMRYENKCRPNFLQIA